MKATGLGEPLQSHLEADPTIPIYTASIAPRSLECSAEIADGNCLVMLDPERYAEALGLFLEAGFAKAGGGKSLASYDVVAPRDGGRVGGRRAGDGACQGVLRDVHRRHGHAR